MNRAYPVVAPVRTLPIVDPEEFQTVHQRTDSCSGCYPDKHAMNCRAPRSGTKLTSTCFVVDQSASDPYVVRPTFEPLRARLTDQRARPRGFVKLSIAIKAAGGQGT
jgi:hypothetical protein